MTDAPLPLDGATEIREATRAGYDQPDRGEGRSIRERRRFFLASAFVIAIALYGLVVSLGNKPLFGAPLFDES